MLLKSLGTPTTWIVMTIIPISYKTVLKYHLATLKIDQYQYNKGIKFGLVQILNYQALRLCNSLSNGGVNIISTEDSQFQRAKIRSERRFTSEDDLIWEMDFP